MKPLDNEKNIAFANDPRRVAAEKELNSVLNHIREDVKSNGSAMYYLTVLPPLLKNLEAAYENLNVIEAKIICELEANL